MERANLLKKQIETYARILWEPEDLVELRTLPAGGLRFWVKSFELSGKATEILKANDGKANIYTGVLPRSEAKGTAEFCLPGRVVWADFDNGIDAKTAWKLVKAKKLPDPSLVVNSGHGTHLFWKLRKKEDPKILSAFVRDFAVFFESDISVSDPARILRLPGFTNWKPPVATAEIKYSTDTEYEFEALRKIIPVQKMEEIPVHRISKTSCEPMIERARRYVSMIAGSGTGGRTNTAYHVACVLTRDFDLSDSDSLSLLSGWDSAANQPPIQSDRNYPPNELEKIIQNARKFGKKAYGELANKPLEKAKEAFAPEIEINSELKDETSEMTKSLEDQDAGLCQTIPLPWERLSSLSKALRPGSILVLAGPSKTGKSYFAINICDDLEKQEIPWKYLPLEDSREDFKWRILALAAEDYQATDIDKDGVMARLEFLKTHHEKIQKMSKNVSENPRMGHKDENGETIVPLVPAKNVIRWARAALKKARVIFIDPLSQIDFNVKNQHQDEAAFIRELLAITKDSGGTTVLIAHTVKRPGHNANNQITGEDVQGTAMYTRLCHTTILIDRHEERESNVKKFGTVQKIPHKRTVTVALTRNGSGSGVRLAFDQGQWGPNFVEYGVIEKDEKRRKP